MHMRLIICVPAMLLLHACAFPTAMRRMSVDYNTVVSSTANELTLLNIVRARDELPLHYTSFNRMTGTFTTRANASLNVPLRGSSSLLTTRSTEQVAPAGTTTTDETSNAVTEGLEVYTPSITGEVSSTPLFEINILDSQTFYQGILSAVPFATIENFVNQGLDNELMMHLFIDRIDFRVRDETAPVSKGTLIWTLRNRVGDQSHATFRLMARCLQIGGASNRRSPRDLIPLTRLTRNPDGSTVRLRLEDVPVLSGERFDLSRAVPEHPRDDNRVMLQRLSPPARVPTLQSECDWQTEEQQRLAQRLASEGRVRLVSILSEPTSGDAETQGAAKLEAGPAGSRYFVGTDVEITFRSTEGVIRHIGEYLRAVRSDPSKAYVVDNRPLFELEAGNVRNALASTRLNGERYSIADSDNGRRGMAVIAIIQQLINLHKSSADRPATLPVQVLNN
jgi:hypothetical protein